MTGSLTIAAGAADNDDVGTYTLAVTASDKAKAMVVHTTTLEITDTVTEPTVSTPLPNQIAPATGATLTLTLTDFFTDLFQEDSTSSPADELTFAVSDSIDDTTMADENIITAMLTGALLELTPGTGAAIAKLWQQETVSITATDSDDNTLEVEFAVTTRANVLDTSTLAPAHGFIIQGDMAGDELGGSVSGAGDVNGDGLDDLIVGAPNGDDGGRDTGEAYIVYGKANPADGAAGTQFGTLMSGRQVLDTSSLAPADGFIIQGDAADDELGQSVSGAGDVNGDGIDDLIVGAPFGDDGGNMAGEAYVIYGKAGTQFGMAVETDMVMRQVVDTTSLVPADGFIIRGDEFRDELGISVSGVGDINSDGVGDLIVA